MRGMGMDLSEICIQCMSGVIRDGICTHCGKTEREDAPRPGMALPARHTLCGQQYSVGRVLGSGGFGITYLAWDEKKGCRVAVKEFFPRHLVVRNGQGTAISYRQENREEFRHCKLRFCQEAQTLYELRRVPEVIDIFHLFEENGTAYFAMEFLDGKDLKGYLAEEGVMQWAKLQEPIRMILRALHAIHGRNLIHRDISPGNVFMLHGGKAKLIDFGNARCYSSGNPLTRIVNAAFAPPEQFTDDCRQGPWTDIYSLSVTIYYALAGILPPSATDRMIAIKSHGSDPARPLHQIRPEIPLQVSQAIEQGMEVTVQRRYKSVHEFAGKLFAGEDILSPEIARGQADSIKQRINTDNGFPVICCVRGKMKGKRLVLRPGMTEMLGRGSDVTVAYPADSPGVSRCQCSFMADNKGIIYVQDTNSSYGTKLNGEKMKPFKWYRIEKGDSVGFAGEEYKIF